jgi:hypothetical protein
LPNNIYLPTRTSPRWSDRLLVHPYENIIAAISLVLGLLLAVVGPLTGATFANGAAFLPDWIDTPAGVVLAAGGYFAFRGLHWTGDVVSKGWNYESTGQFFIFAGFLSLCLMGLAVGLSATSVLFTAAIALGAILRFTALRKLKNSTRRLVEADEEEN